MTTMKLGKIIVIMLIIGHWLVRCYYTRPNSTSHALTCGLRHVLDFPLLTGVLVVLGWSNGKSWLRWGDLQRGRQRVCCHCTKMLDANQIINMQRA